MGQRAYRGKLADSFINHYIKKSDEPKSYCSDAWGFSTAPQTRELYDESKYFQGKLIDIEIEFDLDNPLVNLTDYESVLTKGIINSKLPNGKKINNLSLKIKSKLFGTGLCYLNQNFYVLFGSYFFKDVGNIFIQLINSETNECHNDRNTIINMLDFIVFKTIKLVKVNNCLLYYVIPEYSEFAIVLAYRDVNLTDFNNQYDFSRLFEELVYHPYSSFENGKNNFLRCLQAIERTIPREVNNIILPTIYFKDVDSKNSSIFNDFKEFLLCILDKFQIVSLEIKLNVNKSNLDNIREESSAFVSNFIQQMTPLLCQFKYTFLSFDFDNLNTYTVKSPAVDQELLNFFQETLSKHKCLRNTALARHTNYKYTNEKTGLNDQINFYDYIYFDKMYSKKISELLYAFKSTELPYKVLYKRKVIMKNILEKLFDFNKVYKTNRANFSSEFIKNKKIVPIEVNRNNVVIFSN